MICLRAPRAAAVLLLCVRAAGAQVLRVSDTSRALPDPIVVGSPQDDRLRTAQLLGAKQSSMSLIRAASHAATDTSRASRVLVWKWARPHGELTWNSTIPFSLNDGAQWAGRGLTFAVSGGIQGTLGPTGFVFVPQLWRAENLPFPILPGADPGRSAFASPFHKGFISADLPVRFGRASTTVLDVGESAAWITRRPVTLGISNESQWWGPGIRNALLLSNNAGGFPHVFLRTATPLETPVGEIEAKWIIGGLTESRFFDSDSLNDTRSLSGAVVTLRPAAYPNLTAGLARVVYAPISGVLSLPARSFDVFFRWSSPNVRAATQGRAAEQLVSFFGRLLLPNSSAELYGEWGRMLLPTSLRDLLLAPQFTQGFTIGTQWLPKISERSRLRIQIEMTNLEQSAKSPSADTLSFYTSSVVAQGYTHRGQVIGAAIGPGASSQWLAFDVLRGDHAVGVFAGRIRWDTDAYYQQPPPLVNLSYDASLFGGMRANLRALNREIGVELTAQRRFNYLFQNSLYGYSSDNAFDKKNTTVKLRVY